MIKINISNTKKLISAIEKLDKEAIKLIETVVQTTAQDMELNAKQLATSKNVFDNGDLVQNIKSEKQQEPFTYRVTSYMPYSAYHEFGTGGLVDIKEDWGQMAAYFKGKGIKQVNIHPRPFMYPSYVFGRMRFNKDLRDEFKTLIKKYNG